MRKRRDLSTGSVRGHLWSIALPASVGMLFETLFNFVDTYWAASHSTTALAALSVTFPIFFLIIALVQGLFTAASALVAYERGRGNEERAQQLGGQVVYYALGASVFMTACGLYFAEPLLRFLGVEGQFLAYSLEYIGTIFLGSALFALAAGFQGLLNAHGDTRVMATALVVGFFLNCLLDPWFLHGGFGLPAMGIQGIALATLVVKGLALIYVSFWVLKERLIPERLSRFDWQDQLAIIKHALPASLNMLTIASGILVSNYFISPYGEAAVGAYGICLRIEQLFILPVIGLGIAVLAISGQNHGAGRYDRVQRVLSYALKLGCWVMLAGAVLELWIPERLIGFFTDDAEVIRVGTEYLRVAALIGCSYAIISLSNFSLQGMHRPIFVIVLSLLRQFVVRVGAFALVASWTDWGLLGFWWALFVINWLAAIGVFVYARRVIRNKQKPKTQRDYS